MRVFFLRDLLSFLQVGKKPIQINQPTTVLCRTHMIKNTVIYFAVQNQTS